MTVIDASQTTLTVNQALQQAVSMHCDGKLRDAELLCHSTTIVRPDHPGANRQQRRAAGKKLQPPGGMSGPAPAELAQLESLCAQNNFHEAETLARNLTGRFPTLGSAWKILSAVIQAQGRSHDSLAPARKAAQLLPDDPGVHSNLGVMLKDIGRYQEAIGSFRQALKINPASVEVLVNLGNTLKNMGDLNDAEVCYRQALELDPEHGDSELNLGCLLLESRRLEEAHKSLMRAITLNPASAEAYNNLGNTLKDLGRLDEALACYLRALDIRPDFLTAQSSMLFTMNYHSGMDSSRHLAEARRYGQMVTAKVGSRQFTSWRCQPDPARLRVGFVSGDLRNHPVGFFLEGLLAQINPATVELLAYTTTYLEDDLTTRVKPCFSHWKQLSGLDDESAARQIHKDGVHLLLDLSGHSAKNRLPVFAWKPAPVQASWLGYFATTGVEAIDYLLADSTSIPDTMRSQFTERVCYLPDTRLCFTVPHYDIPVSTLPALKNGFITFGCFQNLTKLSEQTLKLWGIIFSEIPNARLHLQTSQLDAASLRHFTLQRLNRHGIVPERVILHPAVSRESYLAAHAGIDLILDTQPYTGGTTTCEALWMGVPTISLAGNNMISRQGASLLHAAGLNGFIASSEVEYITTAITIANDIQRLAALRYGLRDYVQVSPLFDTQRFARNLEKAFWKMWNEAGLHS
jgi:predicted O-linked N-acetylglucosamine transferase (SPINDLY family)